MCNNGALDISNSLDALTAAVEKQTAALVTKAEIANSAARLLKDMRGYLREGAVRSANDCLDQLVLALACGAHNAASPKCPLCGKPGGVNKPSTIL